MNIHLSHRLQCIADLVPSGGSVIDVGTDHALIPVWLAQTGHCEHIWASDLRQGPLDGAKALIEETGTSNRIHLRLTDGLNGFSREDADTIIIAGMGGETIASILQNAEWTKDDVLLILSPHTKQAVLRRFLTENGYYIRQEKLVKDAGRLYPVLVAQGGEAPAYSAAELHTGLFSHIKDDPLFAEYLSQLKKRASDAAPYDRTAAALLNDFQKMEER